MKRNTFVKSLKILLPNIIGVSSVVAVSILSSSCGDGDYDLVIGNWADYIGNGDTSADNTVYQFAKITGMNVKYIIYDTNETLNQTLPKYDVMFPSDYNVDYLKKTNQIQAIDYSKIHTFTSAGAPIDSTNIAGIEDATTNSDGTINKITSFNYDKAFAANSCTGTTVSSQACYDQLFWQPSESATANKGYFFNYSNYADSQNSTLTNYSIPYTVGNVGYYINKTRFNNTNDPNAPWATANLSWTQLINWMKANVKINPKTGRPFSIGMTDDLRNDLMVGGFLYSDSQGVTNPTPQQIQSIINPLEDSQIQNAISGLSNTITNKNGFVLMKDDAAYTGVTDENNMGVQLAAALCYNGEASSQIESLDKSQQSNYEYVVPHLGTSMLTNFWTDSISVKSNLDSKRLDNAYKFITFMSLYNAAKLNLDYIGYTPTIHSVYADTFSSAPGPTDPMRYTYIDPAATTNYSNLIYKDFANDDNRNEAIKYWNHFKFSFNNV